MKTVGLTGGIGSGKTTIAGMFRKLGVAVYIADDEAKKLMQVSDSIKEKLTALLGPAAYEKGDLNRKFIADNIFNAPGLLAEVNAIVHPEVRAHFKEWAKAQRGKYVVKEAAILFENGGYKECDATILVTAPKAVRLQRVLERDNSNREAVEARMANQWPDAKKKKLADYVIENTDLADTEAQVLRIHARLMGGYGD